MLLVIKLIFFTRFDSKIIHFFGLFYYLCSNPFYTGEFSVCFIFFWTIVADYLVYLHFRMQRRLRVVANRLTEAEIARAMQVDQDVNDDVDGDFVDEEEDTADEQTDSEDDHDSNYEDIPEDEDENQEEEEEAIEAERVESLVYFGRDHTEWNAAPFERIPSNKYRRRSALHKVNLPTGKHIEIESDAFHAIMDEATINIIVKFTNIEGNKRNPNWNPVDNIEILAFIGLLIAAGVDRSSKKNYQEFYGTLRGLPIFKATMPRNRFRDILRFIRFDDKDSRSVRRARDKLAPIRDIFDIICANLANLYSPGENLTIDEQLLPFRGRCSFKQYIPSKPDKYGLKLFWICDAATWYPLYAIPYLGRERSGSARRTGIASDIVTQLCARYYKTGRNVTFDNFFTSLELAQSLRANGLTSVGTVRKNKKFVPSQFLAHRNREEGSNLFGFRQIMTLLSHVPKRNKAVLILSTLHHTGRVEENGKAKINLFYNKTKGGVDVLDELCHTYTVQRKTSRWPLAYFMNLVNVSGIASFVIWRNVNNQTDKPVHTDRKRFLTNLVIQLTHDQIKRRSMSGLHRMQLESIRSVIGNLEEDAEAGPSEAEPPSKRAKVRCYICPSKKGRMVRQTCDVCKRNVCNEHAIAILKCKNCSRQPILNSSDSE